jgi:hypothetical protein
MTHLNALPLAAFEREHCAGVANGAAQELMHDTPEALDHRCA